MRRGQTWSAVTQAPRRPKSADANWNTGMLALCRGELFLGLMRNSCMAALRPRPATRSYTHRIPTSDSCSIRSGVSAAARLR